MGKEAAKEIYEVEICLEEYLDGLNLTSWDSREPVYDIRTGNKAHTKIMVRTLRLQQVK